MTISRLGLSKNAKNLRSLLKWADRHSGKWLAEVVDYNPSLGMKRTDVYPALDELAESRLVSITVPSLRNPKNPKELIKNRSIKDLPYLRLQYLEDAPISTSYLEQTIDRLLGIAATIQDNEFAHGWKNKYPEWDVDQKIGQLIFHFTSIIQCFQVMNLLVAVKGLRKVRATERARLLKFYHLAFKLMKKDRDYKRVWPNIRYRLIVGDVQSYDMEQLIQYSNLRMPSDPCICGHQLRDHDSKNEKCDFIEDCGCGQYKRR